MALPIRYLILALVMVGGAVIAINRSNLNVAIVSMARTQLPDPNSTILEECPIPDDHEHHTKKQSLGNSTLQGDDDDIEDNRYDWDEETKGNILGAFFYSYMVLQIPGVC